MNLKNFYSIINKDLDNIIKNDSAFPKNFEGGDEQKKGHAFLIWIVDFFLYYTDSELTKTVLFFKNNRKLKINKI